MTVEPRARSTTPPPSRGMRSTDRSRASSVTEAVKAIQKSVQGHDDGDTSDSSAPSFNWAHNHTERAPDPRPGDVVFLPADTQRKSEPEPKPQSYTQNDDSHVYSRVIKTSSQREDQRISRASPVQVEPSRTFANEDYEIPLSRSTKGTRDEEISYETEHGRLQQRGTDLRASMSDRLQDLVETGDQSRFTSYNLGAVNFGEEEDEVDAEQPQRRKSDTPPPSTSVDHIYARAIKRPASPPNDIPAVTPRVSAEVPPLDLYSTVGSPRDSRPVTPPQDFPITPKPSFNMHRPRTPPTDFPMTPKEGPSSGFPENTELNRSLAVNPSTGEPGSFQARQRLIEAHLQRNSSPSSAPAPKPKAQTTTPSYKTTPAPAPPPVAPVEITPGVIPPAPPPPPLPM